MARVSRTCVRQVATRTPGSWNSIPYERSSGQAGNMPEITGFSLVDLTVADCDSSARWWQDTMGFTLVNTVQEPTYRARAMIHASGIAVTVMTHNWNSLSTRKHRGCLLSECRNRLRPSISRERAWNAASTRSVGQQTRTLAVQRQFFAIRPSTIRLKSAVPNDTYSARLA
ncbi:VOC family protein [Mycolicibacterium sp. XJ775]